MLTTLEILVRLLVAVLLGGTIGLERRITDHPAGLRTHILVSLAAATFMLVSTQLDFFGTYTNDLHKGAFDPARIASYVVAGMGFLGAGSIMRTELGVQGITTAASLWTVTAIGLASGAGMFVLATCCDILALVTLTLLHVLETQRLGLKLHRKITVKLGETGLTPSEFLEQLRISGIRGLDLSIHRHLRPSHETEVGFRLVLKSEEELLRALSRIESFTGVESVQFEVIHGT